MKMHLLTSLFLSLTINIINAQISINGVVLDEGGSPLAGVQVAEVGSKNNLLTDFNGNFKINEVTDRELEFRYLGYNAKKVGVSEKTTVKVVLERDTIGNKGWIKEVDDFFDNNHWNKRPALYQADYNVCLVKKNIQDLRFYEDVLAQISRLYTDTSDKDYDALKEEEFLQMGIGKFIAEGLTDEERAKILAKFNCLNAKKGVSGLAYIREQLAIPNSSQTVGIEFCRHMMNDKGSLIEGKYTDIETDSIALRILKNRVIDACFPPELYTTKESDKENDPKLSHYAHILRGPEVANFENIIKSLPAIFPDLFSCDDHIGYEKGHFYISMFDKELFLMADFLLEEIQDPEVKKLNINVKDYMSLEDQEYLKKTLCGKASAIYRGLENSKDTQTQAKKYVKVLFPDENCL